MSWFDRNVIDGAVNGVANIAGFTGGILRYIQSGNVQRYAAFLFTGVVSWPSSSRGSERGRSR